MAVLIEAINVIINDKSLDKSKGRRNLFLENIPSKSYCSDGLIHRIGFMDHKFVGQYIEFLKNELGLTFLDNQQRAIDLVVIDMLKGPTTSCDWIVFKRENLFVHREEFKKLKEDFSIAWRIDCYEGNSDNFAVFKSEKDEIEEGFSEFEISFPLGWTPDSAIYTADFSQKPEEELEEISRNESIITYRNHRTKEIVYVGVPKVNQAEHTE